MDYIDKIYLWLTKELKPGYMVHLSDLTSNPEEFIKAVKYLIYCNYVNDIEFSNDYSHIKRLSSIIKPKKELYIMKSKPIIKINCNYINHNYEIHHTGKCSKCNGGIKK
jgi:hypothetical protein